MDKIQTPDVRHEEAWWQIVMIAYAHLYLARSLANSLPNPWERYLRSFSECCANNLDSIVNYDRSDSGGLGLGHALGPVLDRFFVQSPDWRDIMVIKNTCLADDEISKVFHNPAKITKIIQAGIHAALLKHKQAGNPI